MMTRSSLMPPYIKHPTTCRAIMSVMITALLPIYFLDCFFYGFRPIILGAFSVAACVILDFFGTAIRLEHHNWRDFSPVVTGMLIPLMLSASVSFGILLAADIFAIAIAKQLFGGTGKNIVNPAAAGLAFVSIVFPVQAFQYPLIFNTIPIFNAGTVKATNSVAYVLHMGGTPSTDITSVVLGLHPGPMGTLNGVVILACMLYLIARGCYKYWQPLIMIGIVATAVSIFPRGNMGSGESMVYEIMGTSILFTIVFMLADPVTGCTRGEAKLVYAIVAGIVLVLFTYFGAYQWGTVYAVLFMNIMSTVISRWSEKQMQSERRKRHEPSET